MAHDFAKQGSRNTGTSGKRSTKKKSASKKSTNASSSHWSWFLSGLFSGVLVASIAYLAIFNSPSLQTQITDTEPETQTTQSSEQIETELGFYELLAESEVRVDVVPVALIQEVGEEIPTNYLLQAGSFQTRQDADGRLAKVILLNLDAAIVPGVVSGKTWYRVQAGPFAGRRSAEVARNVLSSNNIDTIILLQR